VNDFIRGRQKENEFATNYLKDFITSTRDQDMFEHWDVEGILPDLHNGRLKFDVKALKKVNRSDVNYSDALTWIEGTNVRGNPGWIKGHADYIVFERTNAWVVVKRDELYHWTLNKIRRNKNTVGKGLYEIYSRPNRKDKITLINLDDLDNITVLTLPK
jgi:hypothetical protein